MVTPTPGRIAAVAVPVVMHPRVGECLVVTRRTEVNGHTGARMTNAGDVALFGGFVEPGESAAEAAVRELCEESGTLALRAHPGLTVRGHLGTWTTEAGFHVDGYALDLPAEFVGLAAPEPREVAEIAYLPTALVRAAEVEDAFHEVDPRDHRLGTEVVEFQSPTLRLRNPDTGDTWVLWDLAGHMVTEWRLLAAER